MFMRKLALAAALGVAGLGAAYTPTASAGVAVGVSIRAPWFAPPAPIVERVGVRPGYVWIPGYYRWGGVRYAWVGGYWVHARPGYRWYPSRWETCGRHWCYRGGRWVR
ncbi:MAG: YXWGXW repeat-containing protein [Proteobacteria bacterium]|nr:YXWGXW repeat-containing protein [Pseudomonadota bacterium]